MGVVNMTAASFAVFFKNRFPGRKLEDLCAYNKPFLSQTPKSDELTGVDTQIPIEFDAPQGLAPDIIRALTNASGSHGKRWVITPAEYFAGLYLDAKTMLASRNDEGAYFRAREHETQRLMEQLGQEFEKQLWRSGSGSIGTASNDATGGATITLVNVEDAINFHVGMALRAYTNSGGEPNAELTNVGIFYVQKVNEATGVLTCTSDAALTTPISFHADAVAGMHLIRDGGAGAAGINNLVKGIPAWIPAADPSATLFFGVDRTPAPQKLAGHRQDWLGTIEETAKRLDARMRRVSQGGKELWLSYNNFSRLEIELGARAYRVEDGGQGKFGRVSLMMSTPGGGVTVKCGPYVPEDRMWLLDPKTWRILTLGGLPHVVQDDGNIAVRVGGGVAASAANQIEIRFRAYWQLVCMNPYSNGTAPIS